MALLDSLCGLLTGAAQTEATGGGRQQLLQVPHLDFHPSNVDRSPAAQEL